MIHILTNGPEPSAAGSGASGVGPRIPLPSGVPPFPSRGVGALEAVQLLGQVVVPLDFHPQLTPGHPLC